MAKKSITVDLLKLSKPWVFEFFIKYVVFSLSCKKYFKDFVKTASKCKFLTINYTFPRVFATSVHLSLSCRLISLVVKNNFYQTWQILRFCACFLSFFILAFFKCLTWKAIWIARSRYWVQIVEWKWVIERAPSPHHITEYNCTLLYLFRWGNNYFLTLIWFFCRLSIRSISAAKTAAL